MQPIMRSTFEPKRTEHQEQCALFFWMWLNRKKHPALSLAFAIPNGGHRHIAVARKLKAEGVKPGVPDIFVPWPSQNKCGLFIELKTARGTVTPEQSAWHKNLATFYEVRVCRGWVDAANVIGRYLEIGGWVDLSEGGHGT